MSWKIEIKPTAEKQFLRFDKKSRARIKKALIKLEERDDPLKEGNVKPLTGELKGDYRLRVGKWRILLTPAHEEKVLYIYAILPRGDAY